MELSRNEARRVAKIVGLMRGLTFEGLDRLAVALNQPDSRLAEYLAAALERADGDDGEGDSG